VNQNIGAWDQMMTSYK